MVFITPVTAKDIKKAVFRDIVYEFNECVDYVTKKTILKGELVAKGLVKAIDR
jgi:hypothetical protein